MEESDNISSQFPGSQSLDSTSETKDYAETSAQIFLLQHLPVMQLVPRNDVGERPDAHFVLIGDTAAQSVLCIEIPKQGHGRGAHIGELLNQIGERPLPEVAVANVIVLFVAFDRSLISARDAQGAIGHDAFRIV